LRPGCNAGFFRPFDQQHPHRRGVEAELFQFSDVLDAEEVDMPDGNSSSS
jgi:hypothetical protein